MSESANVSHTIRIWLLPLCVFVTIISLPTNVADPWRFGTDPDPWICASWLTDPDPGGLKSYEPESESATLLPTKLQQDSYFVYKDTKVHHCRKYGEILPYFNNILATVPLVEGKTRFQSSKFKGKKSYFSGLRTRCPCHYLIVTVQAKIEEY
jgi:hypothetical protein